MCVCVYFLACFVPFVVPAGLVCLFRVKEKGSAVPFLSRSVVKQSARPPTNLQRPIDYHDFPRMKGRRNTAVVIFCTAKQFGGSATFDGWIEEWLETANVYRVCVCCCTYKVKTK